MNDLNEFRNALRQIDAVTNTGSMFDCGAKQIAENKFSYEFDGYMTCVVKFFADGSLTQTVDGFVECYGTVKEWQKKMIAVMTIPSSAAS